jgi:hypothetical protein
MDLKNAKVKVPGSKKSVRMVDGHPDLRTAAGRAWKLQKSGRASATASKPAQGNVRAHKPAQGNARPVSEDAVRDELHTVSRNLKLAELHLRQYAGRIRPGLKARELQLLRDDLQREADRLFFVMYPRANGGTE